MPKRYFEPSSSFQLLTHVQSSTTLEEIENVKEFVEKLELIELPNQLVAVIGDPLLQKLLQLKSDDVTLRRVDNWLMAFFEDQLADGSHSESQLLEMLASIRDYARFTKVRSRTLNRWLLLTASRNSHLLVSSI